MFLDIQSFMAITTLVLTVPISGELQRVATGLVFVFARQPPPLTLLYICSISLSYQWPLCNVCYIIISMFVCRFSLAKKCTNEGRALMQLDFQQYRTKVEKISGIRYVCMLQLMPYFPTNTIKRKTIF